MNRRMRVLYIVLSTVFVVALALIAVFTRKWVWMIASIVAAVSGVAACIYLRKHPEKAITRVMRSKQGITRSAKAITLLLGWAFIGMLLIKLVFPFFLESRVIGITVLGLYVTGVLFTGIRAMLIYWNEWKNNAREQRK